MLVYTFLCNYLPLEHSLCCPSKDPDEALNKQYTQFFLMVLWKQTPDFV